VTPGNASDPVAAGIARKAWSQWLSARYWPPGQYIRRRYEENKPKKKKHIKKGVGRKWLDVRRRLRCGFDQSFYRITEHTIKFCQRSTLIPE
jgi:hypothetical protein